MRVVMGCRMTKSEEKKIKHIFATFLIIQTTYGRVSRIMSYFEM